MGNKIPNNGIRNPSARPRKVAESVIPKLMLVFPYPEKKKLIGMKAMTEPKNPRTTPGTEKWSDYVN